jgi:Uma2 family endonuclease
MTTVQVLGAEQRFLLRGIDWQTYQALREAPENDHVRMTYDRGDLEMMTPSTPHEQYAHLIGRMIDVWTEEREINIRGCRSTTFRREDLDRGFELDNCYYVQHEPVVRTKSELDLSIDPAPDLAVEIEISRPATDKLALYGSFGVPEVWRFNGRALRIFALVAQDRYEEVHSSRCLPGFPLSEAVAVLGKANTESETALVRAFRRRVGRAS